MNRKRKTSWRSITFWIVLLSLIGSVIYSFARFLAAPSGPADAQPYAHLKGDYLLMLVQCTLGIVVILLPSLIEKRWRVEIPSFIHIIYVVFLYAAIYLGEIHSFYFRVPHWDTILHAFSSIMLGALGFSIISVLNDSTVHMKLSPLFVAIFAFCFALALGAIWEIYEYAFDGFLGLNMQKHALEKGIPLLGREALQDTMKDLIVDALGALSISIVGFFTIKRNPSTRERLSLKRSGAATEGGEPSE